MVQEKGTKKSAQEGERKDIAEIKTVSTVSIPALNGFESQAEQMWLKKLENKEAKELPKAIRSAGSYIV